MTKAAVHDAPAVQRSAPGSVGNGDVTPAARGSHWTEPDFVGPIRAVARRAGGADPVEIRIRPELHERLVGQLSAEGKLDDGSLTDLDGVRLVVDDEIPVFPGYEIHRVPPRSCLRAA